MLHHVGDHLRGDAWDGELTSGIDIEENDFVELVKARGELPIEVLRTAIEVRLEDAEDLAVGIELTHRADAGVKLIGVVGVVIDEHAAGIIDEAVEAAIDPTEGGYTCGQLFEGSSTEVSYGHSCYGILHIDEEGYTELDVERTSRAPFDSGIVPVEGEMPITDLNAVGTEVRFVSSCGVGEKTRTFLEAGRHGDALLHHQSTLCADERGEVLEALPIGLGCMVDVEVVGIRGGDHRDEWREMVEGAVELIGFDHGIVAVVGDEAVGLVII